MDPPGEAEGGGDPAACDLRVMHVLRFVAFSAKLPVVWYLVLTRHLPHRPQYRETCSNTLQCLMTLDPPAGVGPVPTSPHVVSGGAGAPPPGGSSPPLPFGLASSRTAMEIIVAKDIERLCFLWQTKRPMVKYCGHYAGPQKNIHEKTEKGDMEM